MSGPPLEPAGRLLGRAPAQAGDDPARLRFRFTARPAFCNPLGIVQGGMQMAMLEQALHAAVRQATGDARPVRTLELQASFLRPAQPGALLCEATVRRTGRRTAFAEARLTDTAGAALAEGSAVLDVGG